MHLSLSPECQRRHLLVAHEGNGKKPRKLRKTNSTDDVTSEFKTIKLGTWHLHQDIRRHLLADEEASKFFKRNPKTKLHRRKTQNHNLPKLRSNQQDRGQNWILVPETTTSGRRWSLHYLDIVRGSSSAAAKAAHRAVQSN